MSDTPPSDAASPVRLEITSAVEDTASVVTLAGELDIASAPSLDHAVQDALDRAPGRILIDLGAVTFMDSTGLRALLLARESAEATKRELILRPGPRQVQRVFELSGTIDRFTFEH